jgi:hypothetical protein
VKEEYSLPDHSYRPTNYHQKEKSAGRREVTHWERSIVDFVNSGSSSHKTVESSARRATSEGIKKGDSERIVRASSCAIASEIRVVSTDAQIELPCMMNSVVTTVSFNE